MLQTRFLIEWRKGEDWLGFGCSASAAELLGGVGGARLKTEILKNNYDETFVVL